jgi:hypothetical protein
LGPDLEAALVAPLYILPDPPMPAHFAYAGMAGMIGGTTAPPAPWSQQTLVEWDLPEGPPKRTRNSIA